MKRLWICLLLLLFLSACSDDSGDGARNSNNSGTENTDHAAGGDSTNDSGSDSTPTDFGQPSDSQIRPGVIVQAMGNQCTSNFVYTDGNANFYLGAAAHCFSPDSNSGIEPCTARNEALGIDVEIENAAFMGSLAYTSWQTMKDNGETPGSGICEGNDFALIKIDPRDIDNLHPAARVFEGPTAQFEGDANPGEQVFTYGQSPLSLSRAKTGRIDSLSEDGWTYRVSLSSPAAPGDSGSAVLHESGHALGVLSTLDVCIGLCSPTSNGVVNLEMAMAYAIANFKPGLELVTWSNFSP